MTVADWLKTTPWIETHLSAFSSRERGSGEIIYTSTVTFVQSMMDRTTKKKVFLKIVKHIIQVKRKKYFLIYIKLSPECLH